jgi:hypothetical protein
MISEQSQNQMYCLELGQDYGFYKNGAVKFSSLSFKLEKCTGKNCYEGEELKRRLAQIYYGVVHTYQVFNQDNYAPDPIISHDLHVAIPASDHILSGSLGIIELSQQEVILHDEE